jgi:hypothetical protein
MQNCPISLENMKKCAKSWESVLKTEKVWESVLKAEKARGKGVCKSYSMDSLQLISKMSQRTGLD